MSTRSLYTALAKSLRLELQAARRAIRPRASGVQSHQAHGARLPGGRAGERSFSDSRCHALSSIRAAPAADGTTTQPCSQVQVRKWIRKHGAKVGYFGEGEYAEEMQVNFEGEIISDTASMRSTPCYSWRFTG